MHDVQIDSHHCKLPGSWDEMTAEQLEFLARTLAMPGVTMGQVKLYMALYCLDAHVHDDEEHSVIRIDGEDYEMDAEMILPVQELFAYLFDESKPMVRSALHVNPYPTLKVRGRVLNGADDGLYSITFEQYIYLQTYLDLASRDEEKLTWCLACIWHQGKDFDVNDVQRDAEIIGHLSYDVRQVMLWYIQGCIDGLLRRFPRVFSDEGGVQSGNVLDAQLRLLDALADGDMTKKDLVRHGLLIDALYTLDESVRRKDEIDKKLRNRK